MDEFGAPGDEDRLGLDDTGIDDEADHDSAVDDGVFNVPASPKRKQAHKAYDAASDITDTTVLVQDKERFVLGPLDANAVHGKNFVNGSRRSNSCIAMVELSGERNMLP